MSVVAKRRGGSAVVLTAALFVAALVLPPCARAEPPSHAAVVDAVQPKIVKIHGVGGLRRLESYQTGLLISPEGHILTALSHVLEGDPVTATLGDGRKFEAALLAADPRLEIALLKIDGESLPCFDLEQGTAVSPSARILAFSNLYGVAAGDEPVSVMRGVVSARAPLLARSGAYTVPYRGEVYLLDAITSNPGAAGGALTDLQGRLVGLLGKEIRSAVSHAWLNYAIPAEALASAVDDLLAGKALDQDDERRPPAQPLRLSLLGIVLVPDVIDRTPPFIDDVRPGSPAADAGLQPDDLVIFIDDRLTQSCRALEDELASIEYDAPVKLTVLRGDELIEVMLEAPLGE